MSRHYHLFNDASARDVTNSFDPNRNKVILASSNGSRSLKPGKSKSKRISGNVFIFELGRSGNYVIMMRASLYNVQYSTPIGVANMGAGEGERRDKQI